jgi:hypothetical protein
MVTGEEATAEEGAASLSLWSPSMVNSGTLIEAEEGEVGEEGLP